MEPLPGEVGSPTDYTFEQTACQGGFFVSAEKLTLVRDHRSRTNNDHAIRDRASLVAKQKETP